MVDTLRFIKYVRSFMDGRVRLRHPALRNAQVAALAQRGIAAIPGVRQVEINTLSGSALLLYDSSRLNRNQLMELGVAWAVWLDEALAGRIGSPPRDAAV